MNFKNYKSLINMKSLKEEKIIERKPEPMSVVARLELVSPLIKNFSEDVVNEVNYDFRKDIEEIIALNKEKIALKAHGKISLLDLGNRSVVIGIEIDKNYINHDTEGKIDCNGNYKNDKLSRFIGIYFSKPLFHEKLWKNIVKGQSSLFKIKEIKLYTE